MRRFFIACLTLILPFVAPIAKADCSVRIENAYIPAPPPISKVAAAYFVVTNACDSPAILVDVEAESGISASLHRTSTHNGISRMKPVERIEIDENESVSFSPGGLHIMLHAAELEAGQRFPFHLVFEDGRRIQVLADVIARASNPPLDPQHPIDSQHQKHHSGGGK